MVLEEVDLRGGELLKTLDTASVHYYCTHLQNPIREVEDDGGAGAEPCSEVWQPHSLLNRPLTSRASCLQQVLGHVAAEILQQRHLWVCRGEGEGDMLQSLPW